MEARAIACQEALEYGVCSASVIINVLARRRDPAPAIILQTPDALRLPHELVPTAHGMAPQEGKLMERTQVLELMTTLKRYGMRSAYDEVMGNGIKRRHESPCIVGDLLHRRSPRSRHALRRHAVLRAAS